MDIERRDDSQAHRAASALLPWYVNETLPERDRERVESHLSDCSRCREDLQREQILYGRMRADTALEYVPTGSLKRLQQRLDGLDAVSPSALVAPPDLRQPRRLRPWTGVMAASLAALAVAVGVFATGHWPLRSHGEAVYRTVTTPAARTPGESVRAVFSPTITLVELQAILDEAQLRIVAGPTEAGVYSLAPTSQRPTRAALALLRAHSNVRFAEAIQTDAPASERP